jgi:hypothetical protein
MSHELNVIKVILLPNVVVVDDKLDTQVSFYGSYRGGVKNGSFETVGSFDLCLLPTTSSSRLIVNNRTALAAITNIVPTSHRQPQQAVLFCLYSTNGRERVAVLQGRDPLLPILSTDI